MGVLVKGCNIKHHESRTNNNLICQLFRCQQQREVLSHLSFLLWDELRIINQHVPRAAKGPPQSLFEVLMPMRSEFCASCTVSAPWWEKIGQAIHNPPCPWSIPKNDKLHSYQATSVYLLNRSGSNPDHPLRHHGPIHPHFWSPWWCSQGCAHLDPGSRWRILGEYFRWIGTTDLNGPSLSVACLFLLMSFQTWGWLECALPAMSSTNISAIGYVSGVKRAQIQWVTLRLLR